MTTLEASRAAAGPRQRYAEPLGLIILLCARCDRRFQTSTFGHECDACQRAALKVYGSLHPRAEVGGC